MVKTDKILVKNDKKRNMKMVFVILNSRYEFSNKSHFLLSKNFVMQFLRYLSERIGEYYEKEYSEKIERGLLCSISGSYDICRCTNVGQYGER